MANPCAAHGGSEPISTFGIAVDISAAGLAARFANTAGWFSALVAGAIAGAHYELSTFCGNDPPVEPTLSAQDFVDALSLVGGVDKIIAEKKILDWVGSHIWYDVCKCVDGTIPTPIGYQSNPGNLPQRDPVGVVPPVVVTPCQSSDTVHVLTVGGTNTITLAQLPGNQPVTAQFTSTLSGDLTCSGQTNMYSVNAAGTATLLQGKSYGNGFPNNSEHSLLLPVPAGTDHVIVVEQLAGTAGHTATITTSVRVYCGGNNPGSLVQPCCPPDPILAGQLQQILDMVTLIQRQAVPFGYIAGTVHSTLSGAGAISISGILGVKVAIDTLPTPYGVAGTSPPEHFDLGFVTFGTADGFPSAFRLTRNPQVMMPARASVYTDLDYDLSPGVVVTITELLREP
jgi:hypothetical protein